MLIVVKLFFVAFALFGQAKVFPEGKVQAESELDTIALPEDHPEWVLARRALAAENVCHGSGDGSVAEAQAPSDSAATHAAPVAEGIIGRFLAESCD